MTAAQEVVGVEAGFVREVLTGRRRAAVVSRLRLVGLGRPLRRCSGSRRNLPVKRIVLSELIVRILGIHSLLIMTA